MKNVGIFHISIAIFQKIIIKNKNKMELKKERRPLI